MYPSFEIVWYVNPNLMFSCKCPMHTLCVNVITRISVVQIWKGVEYKLNVFFFVCVYNRNVRLMSL